VSWAVEVYQAWRPWDAAGLIDTLESEDPNRSVRIVENAPGTWALSVPKGSADAALLTPYRWVKFRVDGAIVRAGRIQPFEQGTIEQGEEAAESLSFSGEGALGSLRDATVWPHEDTGRLARDTRFFNFASPDYDSSAWTPAIELYEQGDPGTSLYGVDVPTDWPNPAAFWIWGTVLDLGSSPPMPVGDCYFRTTVTLASEGDYAFFITADDGYELWVDGVLLAAQTEAFIFRNTNRVDQFLDAGVHTVAIKGTNIDRPTSPATNAAGVLFSMYATSAGELTTLELQSDDSWDCLAYPASPPGFTPGKIVGTLMWDAWGREAIWPWWYTWDYLLDSNGDAWPEEVEISFRYTDTILDVLLKLAETYVDFTADEDLMSVDMVAKGGWTISSGVTLVDGVNLGDLTHTGDPSRGTDLLVQDAEGKLTEVSSGLADAWPNPTVPRIEQFVQVGSAGSSETAAAMTEGIFDDEGADQVIATAIVETIAGALPLVDFLVFQTVQMPDRDGVNATTRVRSVTIADVPADQDGELEGSIVYAIEGVQDAS
jgi:hypothetical protein